jgi:predicted DNA-binding antitoxin AbrB/MazE fold protein
MERILIKAVYENGVLKPEKPLPLAENERVSVMVFIGPSRAEQSYGLIKWTGPVEDLDYLINSRDEGP